MASTRQELESFQLPPWTVLIIGKVERFQCGKIAKVAMARRLAIRLYWMGRKGWDYAQVKKFGSHAGQPETGDGVPQNIEQLIVASCSS